MSQRIDQDVVIFVLEEDEEEAILLSQELSIGSSQIRVYVFSTVNEFILSIKTRKQTVLPSCIIIDGYLHSIDISQAAALLRDTQELGGIPILVTLYDRWQKHICRSKGLDVSGYIMVPINIRLLKRFLGNA